MSLDAALRRTSPVLRAGYRVAYATVPGLEERKLKVAVTRPKARVLVPERPQASKSGS